MPVSVYDSGAYTVQRPSTPLPTVTIDEISTGNDDDEVLDYGIHSPVSSPETQTGETLTSLELELEGDYENATSDIDTGQESSPNFHRHNSAATDSTLPRAQKKRKLHRLVSVGLSDQYLYDLDVGVHMGDARTRPSTFENLGRSSSLDGLAFAPGGDSEQLVVEEGSSPRTILPGNALQLHLDDDRVLQNHTPTTATTSSSASMSTTSTYLTERQRLTGNGVSDNLRSPTRGVVSFNDESAAAANAVTANTTYSARPNARVRFRSRVRITSGLHSTHGHQHHNHHRDQVSIPPGSNGLRGSRQSAAAAADGTATPNTTTSGSPSSSISAPLRIIPDENNTLGPLGKRLNSLAQSRRRRLGVDDPYRNGNTRLDRSNGNSNGSVDERTPFLRANGGSVVGYEEIPFPNYSHRRRKVWYTRSMGDGWGEEDEDPVRGLKREEDLLFGKWPWRLFNTHWWWYQCEPVLCCCTSNLELEDD